MPTKKTNSDFQKNPKTSTVTVPQGLLVPANREQEAISISRKEFHYLRDKISKIFCKAHSFSNGAFASFGVCTSSIFALIGFIKDENKTCIIITSFILVISIITFFILYSLSKKIEQNDIEIKSDIIKHMNIIEDRFYDLNL